MPTYKNLKLVKVEEKIGGKNKNKVDGFYRATNGQEFFVKQPKDKNELFAELFAGFLLQEFVQYLIRELITEGKLAPGSEQSLIFADLIKLDDDSYGLIQPKVAFVELFKIIGTGKRDNSDRDPFMEMLVGLSLYPTLVQNGEYFGLSLSLMFSLLLGAFSVHSGNIVNLKPANANPLEKSIRQFARLDWGDAFRFFASPQNADVLSPAEYEGFLNFKKYTKGYIKFYNNLHGIFTAIAEKGNIVKQKLAAVAKKQSTPLEPVDFMTQMVKNALGKIPADFLNETEKEELAKYLCIPEFTQVTFGANGNLNATAKAFSVVLNARLDKISLIKENLPTDESIYKSTMDTKARSIEMGKEATFPSFIETLEKNLNESSLLVFQFEMDSLVEAFNSYISALARQAEVTNLWEHNPKSNVNELVSHYPEPQTNSQFGYAFVPQYRESTILRYMFTIPPNHTNATRFAPYEAAFGKLGKSYPVLQSLCTNASFIIKQINTIQKLVEIHEDEAAKEQINSLKTIIGTYKKEQASLTEIYNHKELNTMEFESNFFYAISDSELEKMSGDQLVTICFEELNDDEISPLLFRVLKNETLWNRIDDVLNKNFSDFAKRQDHPNEKNEQLKSIRKKFELFSEAQTTFDQPITDASPNNLDSKKLQFTSLIESYGQLPPDLAKHVKTDFETRVPVHAFYVACAEYESHTTLSAKKGATESLRYMATMLTDRNDIQVICKTLLDSDKTLQQLSDKKVVAEDTSITEIKTTLQKLATGLNGIEPTLKEKFTNQALACKTLWQAINTTEKTVFSAEIIEDLLQIKIFCDEKLALNEKEHFGDKYSQSIEKFYSDAVTIRLSNTPVKTQAQDIINAAEKEFDPRHSTRRLMADVFMMISVLFAGLGLVLGASRMISGRTFFFSRTPTDRKMELDSLMAKPEPEKEMTRVFAAPSA